MDGRKAFSVDGLSSVAQLCLTLCDPVDCKWTSMCNSSGVRTHAVEESKRASLPPYEVLGRMAQDEGGRGQIRYWVNAKF